MKPVNKKYKNIIIAFIIFMAFMWLCTVISKSIYVSRLPRVQTANPARKYVEHTVEATGIVTEGAEKAITALDGLRVENIFVRTGDRVEEGTNLFRIELEDLQELIQSKELEVSKLQYQISDLEANKALKEQRKQLEEQRAREDYDRTNSKTGTTLGRAEEAKDKADNTLKGHLNHSVSVTSEEDRRKAWDHYNSWLNKEKELINKIAEVEIIVTNMESPPDDGSGTVTRDKTEDEKAELEAVKEQLAALREALAAHQTSRVSQPDFSGEDSAAKSWEDETKQLEDNLQSSGYSKDDAEINRNDALKDAGRKVDDTLLPDNVDSTLSIYALELNQLKEDLSEYREIQAAKGYVKAQTGGMITDIYVSVGGRIPDTAAMLMTDDTVAFQFKATIDKEQKKYIQLGNTMTLKLDQDKSGIDTIINYLEESKTAPGSYDLYCNLPETTGMPGMSGTLGETVTGDSFNCVIPVTALYKEDMRYYVYVAKEREGILGKEIYAEKINVSVLDQNDKTAALDEGILDQESNIITGFSEVFKNGDVIRLEN